MKTEPNEPINHVTIDQDQWCKFVGLTKREYFAALILQGMHASTPNSVRQSCAFFAVKEADKLIEELNKRGSE